MNEISPDPSGSEAARESREGGGALTSTLVDTLKRLLKSRGITYRQLADGIQLSEASVKRIFSEESFTLQRIEEICLFLDIDFFELAKQARGNASASEHMSIEQEAALAADPRLLGVFYLVFNDWQLDDIIEHYEMPKPEGIGHLAHLDRLKLIDLLPNDQVRVRVAKSVRLRQDGPIKMSHGPAVLADFMSGQFSKMGGLFRFEFRELSRSSLAILQRKVDRLAQEFNELAELDSYLPSDERQTVGLAGAIRPWQISLVTGLKQRTSSANAPATPLNLVGARRTVRLSL
jgi:transcriptional regulator with XRE-family HTH domain